MWSNCPIALIEKLFLSNWNLQLEAPSKISELVDKTVNKSLKKNKKNNHLKVKQIPTIP